MAQLRVIMLGALLALAACRASEADTGSGLTPPSGWQVLPSLAKAAGDAAREAAVTIDSVEAWGETARGCYAAWFALRGTGGAPDAMAEQLVTGLSADPALLGIVIRDVVKPVAGAQSGVLSLAFTRGLYNGKLRATLGGDGKIAALACFWNLREPVACDQACTSMIGSMK
jgi:hypothetical protein